MQCNKKQNLGQSLIEVVVAVGMIALLLTAVLALISLSVKNSRLAKDRTIAVGLAQQGVELMRTYRDYSFTDLSGQADGSVYNLAENWTVGPLLISPCLTKNIYTYYTRCVKLSPGIEVIVTVDWQEGSQNFQTVQSTNLSLWER
ncbi:hypothetical protein KKE48_03345 [Patescibacteria group bacterium]|nr:hypothetical protein [Patescibacteria group bacterium]MBU1499876.1 hypothetical protein [Patescibacteria group bacterium]